MARELRAIQYGLGPIGCLIVRVALERGVRFVGAVEVDPEKVGKDLGEVIGLGRKMGVNVSAEAGEVLSCPEGADIVLHATGSYLKQVAPQIMDIIERGLPLISTCEELAYPKARRQKKALLYPNPANAGLVEELETLALERGVAILGTGINPGFIMDRLPAIVGEVCHGVSRVFIRRAVDAGARRLSFQKKIGVGLKLEEFREKAGREIRHVGLTESLTALADFLGWELDEISPEEIEPVIAEKPLRSPFFEVLPGRAAGTRQTICGLIRGEKVIALELVMALGVEESGDTVRFELPPLEGYPTVIENRITGVHGDIATASIVVNSIRPLLQASPGLKTMLDMPPGMR
ncbi:MAG: NAD(P)H-dependent amine dehydrogenase family protein [Anaerolineae bacterium]